MTYPFKRQIVMLWIAFVILALLNLALALLLLWMGHTQGRILDHVERLEQIYFSE